MAHNIKITSNKSNRTLVLTASQVTIILVLAGVSLILIGVLAGMIFSSMMVWYEPTYSSNIQPTEVVSQSATSVKVADDYVVGVWEDNWTFPCTITIKKVNGSYQMTRVYGDGSVETKTLIVQTVNGVQRLIEYPDSPAGDYMVIEDGNLVFYDNQGFIYMDHPKK